MTLRLIFICLVLFLATLFFSIMVCAAALFDKKRNFSYKLARLWAKIVFSSTGLNLEVEGEENISRQKKYVFVCNHESLLDILMTVKAVSNTITIIGKRELFFIPVFGLALFSYGIVPVKRTRKSSRHKAMNQVIKRLKKKNLSLLLFPEATRRRGTSLLPFKPGGFVIAKRLGLAVVPLTVAGGFDVIRPDKFEFRPGKLKLRISCPLDSSQMSVDELKTSAWQIIQENLYVYSRKS